MHAIKQSLRPYSRSSSPAPASPPVSSRPDSGVAFDSAATHIMSRTGSKGPLNRLSLSSLRSRSPAPVQAGNNNTTVTLVQDGSYLEALSLKLSEAITKALSFPPATHGTITSDSFNGRRAIPAGRGEQLGAVIAAELNAAKDKPQLYRAIVRLLHRPFSVMLTNLSAQLLPVLSSPQSAGIDVSANPNPAQLHALAIAGFAVEVIKTFDELALGVTAVSDARSDGLQSVRSGLEAIVGRVLNPLVGHIKQDLLPVLADLEKQPTETWLPVIKGANAIFVHNQGYHPCINILSARIAIHNRALQRYASIAGKSFESTLTGLIINFVWHALVALAHRVPKDGPAPASGSPPSGLKRRLSPPTTPRMTINFKGTMSASRPPSPSGALPLTRATDAKAVCELLQTLPRPPASNALAREAIDEAFNDLRALSILFETLDLFTGPLEDVDLEVLTSDLPTLIALPVLLTSPNVDKGAIDGSVASVLGLDEKEYRQTCLTSFGREDECADTIGRELLSVLVAKDAATSVLGRWLRQQVA